MNCAPAAIALALIFSSPHCAQPPGMEGFWEINWWDGDARQGSSVFTNQTVTKPAGGKWDVSPVWVGHINQGVMSYTIRANMCGLTLPLGSIVYEWFSFPTNDSYSEFWCIGAIAPIGPVVMVFSLDPHVDKALVDAFVEKLKTEHGIAFTDKFNRVAWPKDYKPGDMGEFSFNKPGAPPTIDHAKNQWASQVLAKPYPPP